MGLADWIAGLCNRSRTDQLLDRVAARSQPVAWSRVYPRVLGMDPHQARGYIRARSALVIHREMQIATSGQKRLSPLLEQRILTMASERVVRRTLSEIARQRPNRLARAA
jgi:hypothetical protein